MSLERSIKYQMTINGAITTRQLCWHRGQFSNVTDVQFQLCYIKSIND
jgi:hypothetical protein